MRRAESCSAAVHRVSGEGGGHPCPSPSMFLLCPVCRGLLHRSCALPPLKGVPADTAYIGLAYALRGDQRDAHYVTCCSQVFDMDGGGMQFVAFEARDPVVDVAEARRNPFLSRDDMRAVLARSLELYQGRNAGNVPRRLVIH